MRPLLLLLTLVFTLACGGETPPTEKITPAPVVTPEVTMAPTASVTPLATIEVTPTPEPTAASLDSRSSGAVMIFAAASTTDAVNALIAAFSVESGIVIKTNFAGSSTLAQQIIAGAGADIFLSANEKWMDAVVREHAFAERKDLLGNSLVAIVPADSMLAMKTPAELNQPGVTRLALGDPGAVPAGLYAKAALEKLGLWAGLKGRVVSANDVREALMYVERGEAEAGIVYATDAAITPKVKIAFEFDPALNEKIVYPIARLSESAQAEQVYNFLISPKASEVFAQHGFKTLTETPAEPTAAPGLPAVTGIVR